MELAVIFDIPRLVTAVPMAEGEAPMLVRELEDARGDNPMIARTTSNSLDDARVRAIEASGRKTLLVAGIATEVAVQSAIPTAAKRRCSTSKTPYLRVRETGSS